MEHQAAALERHYGNNPYRPDMYSILIPGQRGRLLSVLYTAGGSGVHPTVLLCHGIPGCERNFDLAQMLRRKGFHVMTFHYSGCWGSDGDYSLRHDLEDAETVLSWLLRDESHGIDHSRLYVVGHSLGGFVGGHLAARHPELRAAVLLMPCNIGRLARMEQEDSAAYQAMRDVLEESAPWLNGTSAQALEQEARAGGDALALEALAPALAEKPLLCVDGTLDTCTPAGQHTRPLLHAIRQAGGTQVQSVSLPTDHCFADYRLTLGRMVCDFLAAQAAL